MSKRIALTGTDKSLNKTLVKNLLKVVDAGLVKGKGNPTPGHMCVEAAVCYALGLPHGDDPKCVGKAVRAYKIRLNDSNWGSDAKRAAGMRRLAVAQLGSDQLDQVEFAKRLALRTVQVVIAGLCDQQGASEDAVKCREVRTLAEARIVCSGIADAAADAAANAVAYADEAAAEAAAYAANAAANAVAYADEAAADADSYLPLSAEMTVQILIEMGSPGCAFLPEIEEGV